MSKTVSQRIAGLIEQRGLKVRAVARLAGLDETVVREAMKGGNPTARTIEKIAAALGVDPATLMSDNADISADETELLDVFRDLPESQQAAFLQLARSMRTAEEP